MIAESKMLCWCVMRTSLLDSVGQTKEVEVTSGVVCEELNGRVTVGQAVLQYASNIPLFSFGQSLRHWLVLVTVS